MPSFLAVGCRGGAHVGARAAANRPLQSYYGPGFRSQVERLLFDSGKPGRPSLGERLLARLDKLLIGAGLRLFALTIYQFIVDPGHGMLDGRIRARLRRLRRDRRWYSKRRNRRR